MGNRSPTKLLDRIKKDNEDAELLIDRLFKQYDKNHTGYIEGRNYERFINDVTSCIVDGFDQKGGRDMDRCVVRLWLKPTLDSSRDGRLSREEVRSNLRAALAADSAALTQLLDISRSRPVAYGSPATSETSSPSAFAAMPLACY